MANEFLENLSNEINNDDLKQLSIYVNKMIELQDKINEISLQLKDLKEEESKLREEIIPMFLESKGMKSITFDTGEKIEIIKDLFVSIPKEDLIAKYEALKWLSINGGGYLIKDELIIDEPTEELLITLRNLQIEYTQEKNVNTNSLKAWFKEQLGMKKGTLPVISIDNVPKSLNLFIKNNTKLIK